MARHVEGPWFRASKNSWYVTHEGRKVSLGVSGKGNRKAAVDAWHKFLREGPKDKTPVAQKTAPKTVADAVAGFLADAKARTKPATQDLYQRHLDKLTAKLGKSTVGDLSVTTLAQWLQGLKVSSTTQAITLPAASTRARPAAPT